MGCGRRIHTDLLASGDWHLHQFTLPDDTGRVRRGAVLRPLRLLAGNPRTTDADLRGVLDAVVAELGCGTGRITRHLAPYVRRLLAVDNSLVMTAAFAARFPAADTRCADITDAVEAMHREGAAGRFDVLGAFWSLSYPLGAYVETLTSDGIRNQARPGQRATASVAFRRCAGGLLAPGGHLLALFFDADSPEQRLVTRAWETIAPTPFGDRGYTCRIRTDALASAEDRHQGTLRHSHLRGFAATYEPHRLCGYLHTLAKTYTDFYETCHVLAAETDAQRDNRLALSVLTADTLRRGLDLLGIAEPDRL